MGSGGSKKQAINPNVVDLSHFEMERMLGRGGFGKVNAAERKFDGPAGKKGEWVAIKTLSKEIVSTTTGGLDMILNERNTLALVHNSFIANLLHTFHDACNCYVVLDLCLGGDLGFQMNTQKDGAVQEDAMKFYVASIAIALHHLHSKHILHRDIKPENVIVESNGHVKVIDFGVSTICGNALTCKLPSGTKGYMSPEIYSSSKLQGAPHDFFALGATAYRMVTSVTPFAPKYASQFVAYIKSKKGKESDKLPKSKKPEWEGTCKVPLSDVGKEFIAALLDVREWKRISTLETVKEHTYFTEFDWSGLENRTLPAPFTPDVSKANTSSDHSHEDMIDMLGGKEDNEVPTLSSEQKERLMSYDFRTQFGGTGGASLSEQSR